MATVSKANTPVSAPNIAPSMSEILPIDIRVKWFVGICAGLFLLFVLAKWHFESVPQWNRVLPDGSPETKGIVAGKPRAIRMDDYAVATPSLLSNANRGFPQENESLGGLKSGLVANVSTHFINIFRPNAWGYMFLDVERGYSFGNMLSILVLVLGAFFLFQLLTKNQFYLSVTGAIVLFLSSGTTSWTFIPAPMIGFACASTATFLTLLHEKSTKYILGQSFLLMFLLASFVLLLYPPFQVPLVYLFSMLIIGYIIQEREKIFPLKAVGWKLGALALSGSAAGIILYLYSLDARETIEAIANTVYPGKRSEVGGTGFIANWFSEYYSWSFSDEQFPKSWLNTCEMAHYLTFAPIIIPMSLYLFVLQRKVDWLLASAILFTILMLVWIEIGFPKSLAEATLFSMSPTRRAQIPLGVGSVFLTIIYLSKIKNVSIKNSPLINTGLVIGVLVFMIYTAYVNINDADNLLKGYKLIVPVLFFTAMNSLLLFTLSVPYRVIIFCTGLIVFVLPNIRQNPLAVGLSPITDHSLYKTVKAIVDQDPDARWMVNGSQFITYMVTATGAKQITGLKSIPERKTIMKVLDPMMKRDSAYNRYAHVTYQTYIDGKDSVVLFNQYEDGYVIAMDPCSPRMKKLNVKYQLFDHQPQPAEIRCMKLVTSLGNLQIYKAND